jgi:hypothetical protein
MPSAVDRGMIAARKLVYVTMSNDFLMKEAEEAQTRQNVQSSGAELNEMVST